MRLFLTGFNHDDVDANAHVGRVGVEKLAEYIARSGGDASEIVVVLSESLEADCDPGDKQQVPGFRRNGECLAWALQQRLGRSFTIEQATHEWTDGRRVVKSGSAVISGGRWRIRAPRDEKIHGTWVFRPELVDTVSVAGRYHAIGLNVLHTSDNDYALPELRDVVSTARRDFPADGVHLTPLFLGDLNMPSCKEADLPKVCHTGPNTPACKEGCSADPASNPCETEYWAPCTFDYIVGATGEPPRLDWPNRGVECLRGPYLSTDDKMQVLSGRLDGPSGFGCAAGTLRAIETTYSSDELGRAATHPRSGGMVPGNAHNVVGLSFEVVPTSPPSCSSGQVCRDGRCQPDCWCGRTAGRCGVDACGKRCGCGADQVCRRGAGGASWCIFENPTCGSLVCAAGQSCCYGRCCDSSTEVCTLRGCQPAR